MHYGLKPPKHFSRTKKKRFYRRLFWLLRGEEELPYDFHLRPRVNVPDYRLEHILTHLNRRRR